MGSVSTYLNLKEIHFNGKITYRDYVQDSLETRLDWLERNSVLVGERLQHLTTVANHFEA